MEESVRHDEPTSNLRHLGTRIVCAVLTVIAAIAVGTSPALGATLTIPSYTITSNMPSYPTVPSPGPSTNQAGVHPDSGSFTTFSYPNATEDLKTALTNFGPGLLGNPESVPRCSEAALEAGGLTCPAGSAIGTSRLDANVAGTSFHAASLNGTLYNAEPLGNEPGRLAAVTFTSPSTFLVSSIPFTITPRGGGDYGLTGTLTDINRLPSPPFAADLQVAALGFVINASSGYVRNPTSCELNTSTGQAFGYDDPTSVDGPPYSFATTGCDQLPFAPKTSLTIGSKGTTKFGGYPPFVFKVTQAVGEADQMGTKLTLPIELNSNNPAYKLCTQAQADSDSCPSNSKFGWATAISPFLSEPVQGPVYLIQQTSSSLPGLLLDLRGRAHVKIQTKTTLINGKQIQSLVLNAPQLPVTELRVALNGGKSTGVFVNRQDLCFKGNSTTKFNPVTGLVKDYGWNGKKTGDDKVTATVVGCGPAVAAKLGKATSSEPSLSVTVTKHPDAANMKELQVKLSKNLRLVKSQLSNGSATAAAGPSLAYVNSRTFTVSGLPTAGSGKVTIRLDGGAVRVSKHSRRVLKRGRSKHFSVKVTPIPVSGTGTSTQTKFKVKGRR
jgi:hypothetical protein